MRGEPIREVAAAAYRIPTERPESDGTFAWDTTTMVTAHGLPLARLLGPVREEVMLYGSGGFTSYSTEMLCEQLAAWAEAGFTMVKMKVGRHPEADPSRVAAARSAIGAQVDLMVDANGAYAPGKLTEMAASFAGEGVVWFEEPVSSDDLAGLRRIRDRAPPGLAIAAGEYNYRIHDFRRMLEAGAVDVMQADASRCLGISGFLAAARLCQAFGVPLSAHTCPSLHLHPACAASPLVHVEYFHDHARIESLLFDGFPRPEKGRMRPDWSRPGLGVELKEKDAERYRVA